MPIEAEKLDNEELIAYFRETLFVQGGLASGWRRTAAEDCMKTIEKRLLAEGTATLPAGVTVIARTVEGAPYPALERPDGTALTREEAAAFLTSFISDFAIVARIPDVELVGLLAADGRVFDAMSGELLEHHPLAQPDAPAPADEAEHVDPDPAPAGEAPPSDVGTGPAPTKGSQAKKAGGK